MIAPPDLSPRVVADRVLDAAEVIAFTRQARADVADAQVRVLQGAAEWVVLHAACLPGEEEARMVTA